MMERQQLLAHFDALLQPERFKDYAPNGLQVEGRSQISRIVSGVTASQALIAAAIEAKADALFVHHGLFWRGYDGRVTGWMRQRLGLLLAHNINLFAYHLPLDAHPQWGNNAQLGERLALLPEGRFGDQQLGWIGVPQEGAVADGAALAARVGGAVGRAVTLVDGGRAPLRRIAWCTGGAQGYFEAAIAAGADAFITGELSEPQVHLARECAVTFIACGHHASERYGAPAFAGHVAQSLGLWHQFIEVDSPA